MSITNEKTLIISSAFWESILNEFKNAVKNKLYKKIDYECWKHLTHTCPVDSTVQLSLNDYELLIKFDNNYSIAMILTDVSVSSFCDFIIDNWYNIQTRYYTPLKVYDSNLIPLEGSSLTNILDMATINFTPSTVDNCLVGNLNVDNYIEMIDSIKEKTDPIKEDIARLEAKVNSLIVENNIDEEKKENKIMKNFNFDFGPCTNDNVRMSMYGIAVKNADGTYVSYNPNTNEVIDVDILNFDGGKYLYKMPVASKDVMVGDVIIHMRKPMFITAISEDRKTLTAVDVVAGESKNILTTRSPFGFDFVTKVVNLFGGFLKDNAPNESNPFGNMWMLALMGDDAGKMDDMLPLMMMSQGNMVSNPMMMYFLMKDGDKTDMLLPLMMMTSSWGWIPCCPATSS